MGIPPGARTGIPPGICMGWSGQRLFAHAMGWPRTGLSLARTNPMSPLKFFFSNGIKKRGGVDIFLPITRGGVAIFSCSKGTFLVPHCRWNFLRGSRSVTTWCVLGWSRWGGGSQFWRHATGGLNFSAGREREGCIFFRTVDQNSPTPPPHSLIKVEGKRWHGSVYWGPVNMYNISPFSIY